MVCEALRSLASALTAIAAGSLLVVLPAPSSAQLAGASEAALAQQRPRIGLVLSGGGARAIAHVGVLQVIEDLRVPVDVVAAASLGAFVGGMYATGMSPTQIEKVFDRIDWFNMNGGGLSLVMRSVVRPAEGVRDLLQLPIPFTALSTDLDSGASVHITYGPLSRAMRASVSITGLFPPIRWGGKLLADGGLVDNLPVNVARQMGADVVIAVDAGTSLSQASDLSTVPAQSQQIQRLLVEQNVQRQLASLRPRDVLIRPDLSSVSSFDLARTAELVERGRAAAMEAAPALRALALSEDEYRAYRAARPALASGRR
jgi:NTE family protein